ncbi:PQQ enzyme repeat protein [Oesophagostomum dentatum]|uniref:PRKR-like endoplasmic reticulum kinase n=1 Tax=Oesophagostomum dentatum TaxID=61180 RepID=A0A0B1SZL5_OESDE|nr:PQQ enzyme repeat protein [Oesophagostomum dentatum]
MGLLTSTTASVIADGSVYDSSRCCRDPAFEDANYLFVSTMDGRLHALDATNGGSVAWVADFETEALMCGTLGKMQPMQIDGRVFNLVPALDGTLYMYSRDEHLLEPIPLSTDILLQASVRVGHDAVAGGRTITTTGVDPLTGEIRYHCSSSHCDTTASKSVSSTLVFRRSTSKVRAVDALTGVERWNLSVSEYDATLVKNGKSQIYARAHRIRYLVQPPDGVITAYDNCGNELWSHRLDSHIVRTWRLENGELSELSLFDADNIHTLSIANEVTSDAIQRSESLFYLGTLKNEPFIMHSSLVKKEMKRLAKNMDFSEPQTPHNQLARSGSTYLIEQGTVDELLSSSYKRSFTAKQAKNTDKQVSIRKSRELQVVASNEGRASFPSISCPSSEGTALIGEKDIRSAAFAGPGNGDQGWFVMRPSGKPKKRNLFNLLDPTQCHANLVERFSKTLRVDHMVSGWWRIIALAMLGLVGSASVVMHALLVRRRKLSISSGLLSSSDSSVLVALAKAKKAETRSTSVGPSVDTGPSSRTPTPPDQITRQRRTTSSHESAGETFHSKFIQDFEPVKLLGHGGFGVVFEAINRLDECPYAVKRIAVSNSERAIQRVLREVRAMAKLDHPSIIRYYHTWIERPPDGWQEEQDTLMLRGMQSRSMGDSLDEFSSESTSAPSETAAVPAPVSEISSEPSMEVVAPPMDECSDDGSWLDDGDNDDRESTTDPEESSDSDDPVTRAPANVKEEESESVIFAAMSSGDAPEASSRVQEAKSMNHHTEIAQLGKKRRV